MKVLVTGGLGFIGSHTVVELIANHYQVVIVDNLINSKIGVLNKLEEITGVKIPFHQVDVTVENTLKAVFKQHGFDGVIHFAGLKAVGESVEKPLAYYYNNLVSTIMLTKMCLKYSVGKFVFSSSATVYGEQESPLREDLELQTTTNPYGETKAISERILSDTAKVNPGFAVSMLRYFNPVGAHPSGLIGEDPKGIPNNLMPYLTKVARGLLSELSVFGSDYDTIDGTGVRDYIHVMDLAEGHVAALSKLDQGVKIYNLGTGKGTSVLELINAFIEVNGVNVPYQIVDRRPGDLATCYADPGKAQKELGWKAKRDIKDIVKDAWRFSHTLV